MKASKKSLHARLYKFTFKSSLPQNLCPYFWKLLWGLVVFIPNLIIQLPVLLYVLIFDRNNTSNAGERRKNGFFTYFIGVVLYEVLKCEYYLIKATFNCY